MARTTSRPAGGRLRLPRLSRLSRLSRLALLASLGACAGDDGGAKTAAAAKGPTNRAAARAPAHSLARAAGGSEGLSYRADRSAATGTVRGAVKGAGSSPDTTIVPTHDLRACSRFTEALYPAADSGVGNAVVWLAGVPAGRPNDIPRRVTITVRECRLTPRVERVAVGGTVILTSHDAIMARFRFLDTDVHDSVRTTVATNDDGQVVPIADVTRTPGLVEIRDDLHPWVRGWLAVAPHPYVAVTAADGRFTFDGVPAGSYTLVVWHERFGTTTQPVTVTAGGEAKADVQLR